MKTSELIGPALDWAVAQAEGIALVDGCIFTKDPFDEQVLYSPSTDWSQGGTIIEREWIEIVPWPNESDEELRWRATQYDAVTPVICAGPTALIAAMRCYVASKFN